MLTNGKVKASKQITAHITALTKSNHIKKKEETKKTRDGFPAESNHYLKRGSRNKYFFSWFSILFQIASPTAGSKMSDIATIQKMSNGNLTIPKTVSANKSTNYDRSTKGRIFKTKTQNLWTYNEIKKKCHRCFRQQHP